MSALARSMGRGPAPSTPLAASSVEAVTPTTCPLDALPGANRGSAPADASPTLDGTTADPSRTRSAKDPA